jgi:hypothetical protein
MYQFSRNKINALSEIRSLETQEEVIPEEVSVAARVASNLASNGILPSRRGGLTSNDNVLENLVSIRDNIHSIQSFSAFNRARLLDLEIGSRMIINQSLRNHSEIFRLISENAVEINTELNRLSEDNLELNDNLILTNEKLDRINKKLDLTNEKLDFFGNCAKKIVIIGGICITVGLFYQYGIAPSQKNFDIIEFFDNNKNNLKNLAENDPNFRDKLLKVGLLKFLKFKMMNR